MDITFGHGLRGALGDVVMIQQLTDQDAIHEATVALDDFLTEWDSWTGLD